jgi:site-specific DNA recombinase
MKTLEKSEERKRMALYARVSTQEQIDGHYAGCQSQTEGMEAFCKENNYEIYEAIADDGYSGATMERPGLSRLRHLVETDQIDSIICTSYDRLTRRSNSLYILNSEFKAHDVELNMLHDNFDTIKSYDRFMESVVEAGKAYERG